MGAICAKSDKVNTETAGAVRQAVLPEIKPATDPKPTALETTDAPTAPQTDSQSTKTNDAVAAAPSEGESNTPVLSKTNTEESLWEAVYDDEGNPIVGEDGKPLMKKKKRRKRQSSKWVAPASRGKLESLRFREKKKGFKGFRAILNEEEDGEDDVKQMIQAIPKSAEEKSRVLAKLKGLPIMSSVSDEMFDGMFEVTKKAGDVVFKTDQCLPFFYIVAGGKFRLGDRLVDYANEQALLSDNKCFEDFVAETDGKLWVIGRLKYQQIMLNTMKKRLELGESLLKNITEIPGLKELPKEQREAIAQALKPVQFKAGEYIMRQNEEGLTMYFIDEGEVVIQQSVDVGRQQKGRPAEEESAADASNVDEDEKRQSTRRPNADNVKEIARRFKGEYIGEGALLEDASDPDKIGLRMADAIAVTDVKCLALSRKDFREYMGSLRELFEHNLCCRVLKQLELTKELTDEQLLAIVSTLEECEYQPGDYIVHQGENGDLFYIIKEGTLECTIMESEDQEEPKRVGTLIAGDYFGEGALLTNEPRRCNVVAAGTKTVRAWALSRKNFERYFSGEVRDVLGRNFSKRKEAKKSRCNVEWDDLQKLKTLGAGSYGTVDLMRHKITGETYALKRIRKATVVARRQQKFVRNENELLSLVDCPFVVNLIRTFNREDSVYMLTEVCLGGELYSLMKDTVDRKQNISHDDSQMEDMDDFGSGCFDIPVQCRFYTACLVLGVEYLHQMGIIHRDIKPENCLLDDRGYLKIADFGFAKMIHDHRTYSLCGTPEYTAPEVYKRCGHGKPVDWWAIGVILYEMASGFSPFHVLSQNSWDCYIEVSKYEKFYPNIHFPACFGEDLGNLLLRLMHPNPTKRYGTRKNNAAMVKAHKFFEHSAFHPGAIDFEGIEVQEYVLPEEFRPRQPESGLDADNFEECEDPHSNSVMNDAIAAMPAGRNDKDWDSGF